MSNISLIMEKIRNIIQSCSHHCKNCAGHCGQYYVLTLANMPKVIDPVQTLDSKAIITCTMTVELLDLN